MIKICSFLVMALSVIGCTFNHHDTAKFHNDGTQKPSVMLAPMMGKASVDVSWSVKSEITDRIYNNLINAGQFYFPSDEGALSYVLGKQDISSCSDARMHDITKSNFIVLVELIDHKEVPYTGQVIKPIYPCDGKIGSVIMMTAMIKVLDMRGKKPKIVLHEVLYSNHLVEKAKSFADYTENQYGSAIYKYTAYNMAHARLANDIAKNVVKYIDFSIKANH